MPDTSLSLPALSARPTNPVETGLYPGDVWFVVLEQCMRLQRHGARVATSMKALDKARAALKAVASQLADAADEDTDEDD